MELNEIFDKVKSAATQVGGKAAKFGKGVVENTKTNVRIMELNSQIDAEYKNAGKLLYSAHCGEDVAPEAIDEVLALIDGKKAELDELKGVISRAKSEYTCPVCGKNVGRTAAFCSACGAKIERASEAPEEVEVEVVYETEAECAEDCAEAVEKVSEECECVCEEAAEVCEDVCEKAEEACECAFEKAEEICEEIKEKIEE